MFGTCLCDVFRGAVPPRRETTSLFDLFGRTTFLSFDLFGGTVTATTTPPLAPSLIRPSSSSTENDVNSVSKNVNIWTFDAKTRWNGSSHRQRTSNHSTELSRQLSFLRDFQGTALKRDEKTNLMNVSLSIRTLSSAVRKTMSLKPNRPKRTVPNSKRNDGGFWNFRFVGQKRPECFPLPVWLVGGGRLKKSVLLDSRQSRSKTMFLRLRLWRFGSFCVLKSSIFSKTPFCCFTVGHSTLSLHPERHWF